jgi:hypothetical protein
MTTVTKIFAGVGVTEVLTFKPGESVNWSITGSFSATLLLERSKTGGLTWEVLQTKTAAATGTYANGSASDDWLRFRCSAYTSGSPNVSVSDADDLIQEWRDRNGNVVLRITDGQVLIGEGTSVRPALAFMGEPGLGLYRIGTNALAAIAGSALYQFSASGLIPSAHIGWHTADQNESGGVGAFIDAGHNHNRVFVLDNVAFTVFTPFGGSDGTLLLVAIYNTSGGALGAVTWEANYKLAGAWVSPATGFNRSILFARQWTGGTVWHEISRTTADVPN